MKHKPRKLIRYMWGGTKLGFLTEKDSNIPAPHNYDDGTNKRVHRLLIDETKEAIRIEFFKEK